MVSLFKSKLPPVYSYQVIHNPDQEWKQEKSNYSVGNEEARFVQTHYEDVKKWFIDNGHYFDYRIQRVTNRKKIKEIIGFRKRVNKQDIWAKVEKAVWLVDDLLVGLYKAFW